MKKTNILVFLLEGGEVVVKRICECVGLNVVSGWRDARETDLFA